MSFHPPMEYAPAKWHRSERKLAEPGEPFTYTPENQAKFDEVVQRYPPDRRKSAILFALYLVQNQLGYITASGMRHVAQQIGCTAAEVEDVVSYYTMFYTRPVGKYVLNVCRTLSCALLGAERVTEELSAKLGIKPGETDPSPSRVERPECAFFLGQKLLLLRLLQKLLATPCLDNDYLRARGGSRLESLDTAAQPHREKGGLGRIEHGDTISRQLCG